MGRTPSRPILHVRAHAAQGPDGQLVRLSPTQYNLLSALAALPPLHVIRYSEIERFLWPDGCGQPFDVQPAIRWHVHNLNRLLTQVGYKPRAVQVIDRVGLAFAPVRANDLQTKRKR